MKVLFVCTGNICRSPMAQGVFQRDVDAAGLARDVSIDSAGTHAFHVGESPDERGCRAADKRSVSMGGLQARCIEMGDFDRFDYIVAMDRQNLDVLRYLCPAVRRHTLHLFSAFSPALKNCEIPDPYQGEEEGFEEVLDMIELASRGLIETIEKDLA